MHKFVSIPVSLLFFVCNLFAQREADNWLFGSYCSVNFSIGQPVSNNQNPNNSISGTATMSDHNGNLLFYSNGHFVYNRLHQLMPSGVLLGGGSGYSQPVLAVPYPGHDSLYYLFYIEYWYLYNYTPRLRYSIINMNRQNGLGDVQLRDQLLLNDSICAKFTATLHCNKRDIWLIGHLKNSDKYYSYLITSNGISSNAVFSTGAFINESNKGNHRGYMKVSPLGDKVASAYMEDLDFIELSDFNSQTGQVTNPKILSTHPPWTFSVPNVSGTGAFGVEFSPSGKFLYVTSCYNIIAQGQNNAGLFYQFNLSSNNGTSIQASRILIDSALFQQEVFKGLQLANDGKIYVASNINFLHVVNNPEQMGSACNFLRRQVNTGSNTWTNYDLPVFLQSYLRYPIIATGNCQFQNISFSIHDPTGITSLAWNFGDPGSGVNNSSASFTPTHIFSAEGSYLVKAILSISNGCGADTITKIVHAGPFKVYLGNDTTICQGDTLKMRINIPGGLNTWSNQSNDTVISITQSGTYWIRVNLGDCSATDTINVSIRPLPVFTLGHDTTICKDENLTLSASPNSVTSDYLWNNGATSSSIIVNTSGVYWLQLIDSYRCTYRDSIIIQYKSIPYYSLGSDSVLCQRDLQLNATIAGASSYLWNTGSSYPAITVNQSGIYWADVSKDGCTYRDSIQLTFIPYPIVSLGSDTTLCESAVLLLDAHNNGASYLWQDHSSAQTYLVDHVGSYFVKVTSNGCSSSDTLYVNYNIKPGFTLGSDFSMCAGQTTTIRPTVQTGQSLFYLWQDGSSASFYNVTGPGIYSLKLSNNCGDRIDSIIVLKGACKLYIPTAFTPNGDGLNDIFKAGFGENITQFKLSVFNRWGQKVFESSDIQKGWNGSFLGKPQPEGVFVWLISYTTLTDPQQQVLKGTVLLVRSN
jgi:gliding motility-associated-like protein